MKQADTIHPMTSDQVRTLIESLTCRDGNLHYCPNHDGLIDRSGKIRAALTAYADLLDRTQPMTSAPNVLTLPRWKCRYCGCLWRDNLGGFVSLFDAHQKSCAACEAGPTRTVCDIDWFRAVAASPGTGGA